MQNFGVRAPCELLSQECKHTSLIFLVGRLIGGVFFEGVCMPSNAPAYLRDPPPPRYRVRRFSLG